VVFFIVLFRAYTRGWGGSIRWGVIKDKKTGAEKTIAVNPGDMTSLKKDAAVKVTLEPGTNKAQSIKLGGHKNKDKEEM